MAALHIMDRIEVIEGDRDELLARIEEQGELIVLVANELDEATELYLEAKRRRTLPAREFEAFRVTMMKLTAELQQRRDWLQLLYRCLDDMDSV